MAHPEQLRFVELVRSYFGPASGARILEVGSYDVNGSVRRHFRDCDYVGADLTEGPGVDLVASGHEMRFEDGRFDLALSCECFEHNPYWRETFLNMARMTRPGGMVAVTCASKGRLEHGTARTSHDSPGTQAMGMDYYLNLGASDFGRAFDLKALFKAYRFFYIRKTRDLYFVGWKGGPEAPAPDSLGRFEADVKALDRFDRGARSWPAWAFSAALDLPILLAMHLLPGRAFQNVAVPYVRARWRFFCWAGALKRKLAR